ncbi:MAG: hypothetical protein WAO00_17105 [Chthoniobacterales bacterium]
MKIPNDADFLIKRFEQPDEVRVFAKGKFEIVKIGSMTIGRGCYYEMKAGDLFYIGPGHDSWVVGNEPYVSLHFLGAEHYAS